MPKNKNGGRPQGTPKSNAIYRQNRSSGRQDAPISPPVTDDLPHAHPLPPSHFQLNEDGSIQSQHRGPSDDDSPSPGGEGELSVPKLTFSHDSPFVRLYLGNCLELLDAIAAKYPQGRFDAIFADPPYFLSNGGITCHAGRMVKVDKGDWDKSRGPELNHEFNLEWLRRCQRVLKPNGTIWVSGTHHVIFSIGYAMQQLGYKILNDIAWEKPNPPPNLSCRYFTHSTETILWAARDDKTKHLFNYQAMRKVTGKQMKTVWRDLKNPESDNGRTLAKIHGASPTAFPSPGGEGQGEGDRQTNFITNNSTLQKDLDLFPNSINGSRVDDKPQVPTECIFHECKFVFLSCAEVERGAVVHTTVDVSLQEAWAKTPNGKKRETTHIVRCETEIFKLKP